MVVAQKYDVIDLEKGKLDRTVFGDEQTYQDELEKIFGRAWLMLAHESLLPNPNDFFLSYIGEDPVIITRDAKGQLHVFLNMCRHRGNRVVRADDGNAKNFMCTYHGWTFSNEGKLVSVPGLQEAYYGELDVEHLGLVEARVDTYAGIIFGTWADDAPSLEDYLGDARYYLDVRFNRRDIGLQAIGPVKWQLPVNWKTAVDNASDNYHAPVSHFSSTLVQSRYAGRYQVGGGRVQGMGYQWYGPSKHTYANGHCITVRVSEEDNKTYARAVTLGTAKAFEEFYARTLPEAERRLGTFRARRMTLGNHGIFPNTFLEIRFTLPRGPLKSEIWSYSSWEKDAPDEVTRAIRLLMEQKDNASGLHEQDDTDNWRQVTYSGKSPTGRKYLSDLSLGIGHTTTGDSQFPGIVAERFISESNQRNYYSRWQEFMNAESWADIHIDPITANFEGTATAHS